MDWNSLITGANSLGFSSTCLATWPSHSFWIRWSAGSQPPVLYRQVDQFPRSEIEYAVPLPVHMMLFGNVWLVVFGNVWHDGRFCPLSLRKLYEIAMLEDARTTRIEVRAVKYLLIEPFSAWAGWPVRHVGPSGGRVALKAHTPHFCISAFLHCIKMGPSEGHTVPISM